MARRRLHAKRCRDMIPLILAALIASAVLEGGGNDISVDGLLTRGTDRPVAIGSTYDFSAYASSKTELRFYLRPVPRNLSPENCISAVYGSSADRGFFKKRHGKKVNFRAVVAGYQDGNIVGANDALGDVSLSSFHNYCSNAKVLVITAR